MTGSVDVLARIIGVPLHGLRLAGVEPAAKLSPNELRGTAHLLGRGIMGTLWQARRRAPRWDEISRAWSQGARTSNEIDVGLYGRFAPEDRLTLLTNNREAFATRARLCASARTSVDLATYYLHDDETGRSTVRALVDAARRGVRVRLCADAYIMQKKAYEGLGVLCLVDELHAGGVEVRLWRDASRPYDTNHRKMLSVDGRAMLIGGRNIADHYEGSAWRDVDLLVEGPTAAEAIGLFERTFAGATEPSRIGSLAGGVLHATMPADVTTHANFVYLLQCLRAARRSVDIENAYYFSHEAVAEQIAATCRRGVRVRVFTNSAESNDLDYANYRLYSGFRAVLRSGAELWLRRGKGRTLHCKYFVADGAWVSLGSSNLDYYSPRYCTEANVHAFSEELGAQLTTWFEEGLADAERLTDEAAIEQVLRAQTVSRAVDALLRDVQ
ncbi:MAG TPA: phosphatidylserine/phosphatidylglycerophosphate/cardiolipin synthase family protein [Labilithrix sp.]|nr:phosphatidylserine/phosphatidylglycerophosphate/cardiolipin synthase family protein [Labilithrix sp.]